MIVTFTVGNCHASEPILREEPRLLAPTRHMSTPLVFISRDAIYATGASLFLKSFHSISLCFAFSLQPPANNTTSSTSFNPRSARFHHHNGRSATTSRRDTLETGSSPPPAPLPASHMQCALLTNPQAAEGISDLKVENVSPIKIPSMVPDVPKDQYGNEKARPIVGIPDLKKETDAVEEAKNSVAATIKSEEASEPLLRENPNRFVLFPIKYNEVCFPRRVYTRPTLAPPMFRRPAHHHHTRPSANNPCLDLANVQEGRGILLDSRRNRPQQGPPRLEPPPQQRRTLLRLTRPCLLRRLRWHRKRKPRRALLR